MWKSPVPSWKSQTCCGSKLDWTVLDYWALNKLVALTNKTNRCHSQHKKATWGISLIPQSYSIHHWNKIRSDSRPTKRSVWAGNNFWAKLSPDHWGGRATQFFDAESVYKDWTSSGTFFILSWSQQIFTILQQSQMISAWPQTRDNVHSFTETAEDVNQFCRDLRGCSRLSPGGINALPPLASN